MVEKVSFFFLNIGFGEWGIYVNVSGVGVLKNVFNWDVAIVFLEYLVSDDV